MSTTAYEYMGVHPQDTVVTSYSGYDDKVNLDRTNPIWQFLDRDYSMNNRFIAEKYNAAGLPAIITTEDAHSPFVAPVPFSFLNDLPLPLTVSYNCELPGMSGSQAY
jgi:hypothetical protein